MFEKSGKRLNIWLPFLFSLVTVIGILIGIRMRPDVKSIANSGEVHGDKPLGIGTIEEIIRFIDVKYVENVDREELVSKAVNGLLKQLDPHSSYISAKDIEIVNSEIRGDFVGIGISYVMWKDTLTVVDVLPGSPADKVDIRKRDKLIFIGDTLIAGVGIGRARVLNLIRGEKKTLVNVRIKRLNEPNLIVKTVTRDEINISSIEAAYEIVDEIGYIKISRFKSHAFDDFLHTLEKLVEEDSVKHLIIDVRGNPGGYMSEVVKILNQLFSDKGKLLVYTEGKHNNKSEYKTTGRAFYDIDRVSILVDEKSASASEILAGAIQDWDRGVVIGRRSFGKGLVQEQYYLSDGSAIRLTVAKYFTPSGRCIQKSYALGRKDYADELTDRLIRRELYDRDSIIIDDTVKYYTAGGRVVFGGGGIVPDIFIPFDSVKANVCFLFGEQQFENFVLDYMSKNYDRINAMGVTKYIKEFNVSDEELDAFYKYCRSKIALKDLKKHEFHAALITPEVAAAFKTELKKGIGCYVFGELAKAKIANNVDPIVEQAIDVLKKDYKGILFKHR